MVIILRIIHELFVHTRSAHKLFELQISHNCLSFNNPTILELHHDHTIIHLEIIIETYF